MSDRVSVVSTLKTRNPVPISMFDEIDMEIYETQEK